MTWPLIFRRLRKPGSRADPPVPSAAASFSAEPEQERSVRKAPAEETIRAKVNRILKDLPLDAPTVNIAAVVGGKKESEKQSGSAPAPKTQGDPGRP